MRAPLHFVKNHKVDFLLAFLASISLGLFSFRSMYFERASGINAPIATLEGGSAERKESGSSDFAPASQGTEFYNLDVIWVPPGQRATLRMDDFTHAQLEEKTLVVLKKPFKGGSDAREKLKTIQGKVVLLSSLKDPVTLEVMKFFTELPDAKKTRESSTLKGGTVVAPAPDTVFFLRQGASAPISFALKKPLTGFLIVSSAGHPPVYRRLQAQQSIEVSLEVDRDYLWQVLGPDQSVVEGPFRFSVRRYDPVQVKKALAEGRSGKIQILME